MALRNNTRTQATKDRMSRFTLTLNNYSQLELDNVHLMMTEHCTWAVCGKETGEEGTPHLQGAGVLKNRQSFSTVKKWFPRAHLEKMRGQPEQNLEYCSKEDLEPFTCGEMPKPGKRTDLHDVAEMVNDGCTLLQIAEHHPTSIIKYHKGITVLRSIRAGKRDPTDPPKVYWLFGAAGTGKTRFAWDYGCSIYGAEKTLILPDQTLKWFDCYDGQDCVIIDDFRAKGVSFPFLLRVLDRYPLDVPCKGAFLNWNPKVIFITTPTTIDGTFETRLLHKPEDMAQLRRRVTASYAFPTPPGFTRSLDGTISAANPVHGPVGGCASSRAPSPQPGRRVAQPNVGRVSQLKKKKPPLLRQGALTACKRCGMFNEQCYCN